MFFERRKKEAQQKVLEAIERGQAVLSSNSVAEVREANETLRTVWSDDDHDNTEALSLMVKLDARIGELAQSAIERMAHPCMRCGCGEHRVSEAFRIRDFDVPGTWMNSPTLRMWVCASCGVVELVADDLTEIKEPFFKHLIRAPDPKRGPFR